VVSAARLFFRSNLAPSGSFPRIARCHDLRALPEQYIYIYIYIERERESEREREREREAASEAGHDIPIKEARNGIRSHPTILAVSLLPD
jgi:hypothetical protein